MDIKTFPKIFAIGTDYITGIFDTDVEVTEKIDGSQFAFGKVKGELVMRSKNQIMELDMPPKMFKRAVDYVLSVADRIPDDTILHCEYLEKPKHNVLTYDRTPTNYLTLFGVSDPSEKFMPERIDELATLLGIEPIPVLFRGRIEDPNAINEFLERTSVLGGSKIEGIVVKNYTRPMVFAHLVFPFMAGKYVSEAFKEVHKQEWKKEFTSKGRWLTFVEGYHSEARWAKAVQHLRDQSLLENSPKDIGRLMKEINTDIEAEDKQIIMEFLWQEFGKDLLRKASFGFPQWYKAQLLQRGFTASPPHNQT